MQAVIFTLAEKRYHYGLGALVNSLYQGGFRGKVYCGTRGELPTWIGQTKQEADTTIYSPAEGLEIHFVKLTTTRHFALYKTRFMLDMLPREPQATHAYFIDADIVVKCKWETLQAWTGDELAVCEDACAGEGGYVPERHPLRRAWSAWLKQENMPVSRQLERYFNSGFLGISLKHKNFLELWNTMLEKVCAFNGNDQSISFKNREHLFYIPDQDSFNLALMRADVPINAVGIEGMDFGPHGYLLSHAVRHPKPWDANFLLRVLIKNPPSKPERYFVKYLERPIKVFGPLMTWWKKTSLKIAQELSRL